MPELAPVMIIAFLIYVLFLYETTKKSGLDPFERSGETSIEDIPGMQQLEPIYQKIEGELALKPFPRKAQPGVRYPLMRWVTRSRPCLQRSMLKNVQI